MKRANSLFSAVLFNIFLAQAQIVPLKITHLTGDFYIYTTYKIYKGDITSANGMYLLTEKGVVLIDTPWDTTQFQPLLDSIRSRHNKKVVLCIATHSHEDRAGGLEYYRQKNIDTFASRQTDSICKSDGGKRPKFTFTKDTTFTIGNYSFQTCYAGGGHTSDNQFIWFEKGRILYGGCAVKSTEATDLGYIGEADLKAWPLTLDKIKKKFPDPEFIIPGHQDWSSLKSIDHTLDLLKLHQAKQQ